MSDRGHQLLYRAAQAAARRAGAVPDAELVRQLARHNDRAAFELLLWRHGPAVWGVCRRVLGSSPDAEEVFQAVFLALSRKAGTIGDGSAVAGWLHRVAVRAAVKAAKARTRRAGREATVPEPVAPDDPVRAAIGRELGTVLDAAIARLPDRYRLPFLLCEVYGRAPAAVAAELNCAVGTVASRLSRAKRRLRATLARRGVALPATLAVGVLPAGLSNAALRSAFTPTTMPVHVAALADRVTRPMPVGPWKLAAAACLVAASAGLVGLGQMKTPAADKLPPPPPAEKERAVEVGPVAKKLPDGAVTRIGSEKLRHAGAVYDVAFSPDGKLIATAGSDGAVVVWDAATGERRFQFPAHYDTRVQTAFMQGGKELWVYSPHGSTPPLQSDVRRFNLADGKELSGVLTAGAQHNVFGFGTDPLGKRFGYVFYEGVVPAFAVVEAGSGKEVARLKVPDRWSMRPVFAPGGKVVTFPPGEGLGTRTPMPIVEVETGTELARIADPDRELDRPVFSPDGKTVAAISYARKEPYETVGLWDATTGKLQGRITGLERTASCLAISPDGKRLAVGNLQRMAVQLFDVGTGKELRRFRSYPSVVKVAFSPDGKHLAAARTTGTVSVWDIESGEPTAASADPDAPVRQLAFVGRDQLRLVAGEPVVADWRTGKVVGRLPLPPGVASPEYVVSPDGTVMAAPNWTGPITLYDAATGTEIGRLAGHTVMADPVVFSPDGTRLFSRGHDQTVRAWDVAARRELWKADFDKASSGDRLAVSPDGRLVAGTTSAGADAGEVVQVWDAATGRAGPQFRIEKGRIAGLAFAPDGSTLAITAGTGWADPAAGSIVLGDTRTGAVRRTLSGLAGLPIVAAFTPDGRSLVTGGSDGIVHVWELATGKERRAFPGQAAYTLAVSPDGRHVASAGVDVPTLVWDLYSPTGGPIAGADGAKLLADLAGNSATAFTAIRRLVAHPTEAVALLKSKLQPAAATDPKRIAELVTNLDAGRFAVREQAAAELQKLGDEAEPALRSALAGTTSAEARERLAGLLAKLVELTPDRLRELRAAEALEAAGTPEAAALLAAWAKNSGLRLSRDAARAKERLVRR